MKRVSWLAAALLFLGITAISSADTFALAEVGVGIMAPGGDGDTLGKIVLVPNVLVSLFLIGAELDLWISPGNDAFYILPFLLLRVPLLIVTAYGGIGPRFSGSANGLTLVPPYLELNLKIGASARVLPLISAYGEVVARLAPLQGRVSGLSLIVGGRVGF
ncbi:hypothetical protein HYR53_10740 [Candidatus Acetothermia bacterium]|nr:hypothetical protein [Candidatus Acetothermia bacterium]